MPYISKEEVKAKRTKIRSEFKTKDGWKLSVTGSHFSSINVYILEAPINMLINDVDSESVNVYYIEKHYKANEKAMKVLLRIKKIISANVEEEVYDGDYGSVPTFYFNIDIGRWDKPFKINKK